jgi:hypothetical protein
VRAELILVGAVAVAYGLGTQGVAERLPSSIGPTLGELHHEINQLATGNFGAVLPSFRNGGSGGTVVASADWTRRAFEAAAPRPVAPPVSTTPSASPLPSFGQLAIGAGLGSQQATGSWARELTEEGRAIAAARQASGSAAMPVSTSSGVAGFAAPSDWSVGRVAEALTLSPTPLLVSEAAAATTLPAAVTVAQGPSRGSVASANVVEGSSDPRLALVLREDGGPAALSEQRQAMTTWARSRGYRVVDFFTETAGAGAPSDLLAAVQSGAFGVVAVWQGTQDADPALAEALRSRKVQVVTVPDTLMPAAMAAMPARADHASTGSTPTVTR